MRDPYIILGGKFSDHRGELKFVNEFSLKGINRFYTIKQSPNSGPRAWQGHKTEAKYFYCVEGSFTIKLVKISNWEKPDDNPKVKSFILDASKSELLVIPGGYANGVKAMQENSQLLVFSEKPVEESIADEQRFEANKWINWNKV